MASSLKGSLLVAGPRLIDPNFYRSVVLVGAHDEDGALGLVLNRPTGIDVGDHLPGWVERLSRPEVVFAGGPVQPETAIGLGRRGPGLPPGWSAITDEIGLVDLTRPPAEVVGDLEALRVFSGYAGWGPGQLESELAGGDWLIVDAESGDAFADDPETMWRTVLRRRGGRAALYGDFPLDPRLN